MVVEMIVQNTGKMTPVSMTVDENGEYSVTLSPLQMDKSVLKLAFGEDYDSETPSVNVNDDEFVQQARAALEDKMKSGDEARKRMSDARVGVNNAYKDVTDALKALDVAIKEAVERKARIAKAEEAGVSVHLVDGLL
jgi:hypothetical protein